MRPIFIAMIIVLQTAFSYAVEGYSRYVQLTGKVTEAEQQQLAQELLANFTRPVDEKKFNAYFEYSLFFRGDGTYFWNFQIDPASEKDIPAFEEYLVRLVANGFRRQAVWFRKVIEISTQIHLLIGTYEANSFDYFKKDFEIRRSFFSRSLDAQIETQDVLANRFFSPNNSEFLKSIEDLLQSDTDYALALNYLRKDNIAALQFLPRLVLEDGTIVDPDSENAAVDPAPLYRDCWDAHFEHGNCAK